MVRTLTPPMTDSTDPSGRRPRTGGRRVAFSRDQELGPGSDLAQELPAVKAAVHQHQHRVIQQAQQLARPADLPIGRGSEHRADQRPGARLHQRHELDDRISGLPERGVHLAQQGTVPGECRGPSATGSRRRPPSGTGRSALLACAAGPAARPAPRTAPSPARCRPAGAGPAAPSATARPGPARPAPPSASPTPPGGQAMGTAPAPAGNRPPTREGSSRSRRCLAPVSSSTASTSSNGTTRVSSPR